MSMRINKRMGYGMVSDYNDPDSVSVLDKINGDSILLAENRHGLSAEDIEALREDYLSYAEARFKKAPFEGSPHVTLGDFSLDSNVLRRVLTISDVEYPEDNPLEAVLLVPFYVAQNEDWARSDDDMDYMEHNAHTSGMVDTVEFFSTNLFPFSGYVHTDTLARLDEGDVNMLRNARSMTDRDQGYASMVEHGLVELGFTSLEEFDQLVAPACPAAVLTIAEWANLFVDPDDGRRLRPMIYTYWS